MKPKSGPVAAINSDELEVRERMERGAKRREAFAPWMNDEGSDMIDNVLDIANPDQQQGVYMLKMMEHALWRAFTAGDNHGRNNA